MTALRLVYQAATGQAEQAFRELYQPMARAATAAMRDVVQQALSGGRASIAAAGFSKKWQNALRGEVYPRTGASVNAAGLIHHKIPYAGVFETGATLTGKPLLWLPIGNGPSRIGGRRMTPRNYTQAVGPLHSINVPGKPPMLAAYAQAGRFTSGRKISLAKLRSGAALARLGVRQRRGAYGGAGVISVPLFVGVPSVRVRQAFGVVDAVRKAHSDLGAAYLRNLQSGAR